MRVEPGLSEATVLVLANDVVHDVGQQAGHHQDLHVITLPAVLQMCRNLQRNSKRSSVLQLNRIFKRGNTDIDILEINKIHYQITIYLCNGNNANLGYKHSLP